VLKAVKFCCAILLIPLCYGTASSVVSVVRASGSADTFWVAIVSGAGCWVIVYLLLPKPIWIYVVGHEFTHVLWAWLFGGRVKRFRATSKGGHVIVAKDNFLISLAPYFFPLYAVVVIVVFFVGDIIWDWTAYLPFFHLLLGAAYAFHITLTLHILRTQQSDITRHGILFAAVVIWLGTMALLMIGVSMLTAKFDLQKVFESCWVETRNLFFWVFSLF